MNKQIEKQALDFRTSLIYREMIMDCKKCLNTGVYQEGNGTANEMDDFEWVVCDCGLKALKGSEERYSELVS